MAPTAPRGASLPEAASGRSGRAPSVRSSRGRLLRPGDVLCRRPLWFCRHNPGGARWRRGGRLRGGGREDLRHVGKKRVRSDSRARLGNAGPGGPATSKPSPGVSARVCEKTAVGGSRGCVGRLSLQKGFRTETRSVLRPGRPFLSPPSPLASRSLAWEDGTALSA